MPLFALRLQHLLVLSVLAGSWSGFSSPLHGEAPLSPEVGPPRAATPDAAQQLRELRRQAEQQAGEIRRLKREVSAKSAQDLAPLPPLRPPQPSVGRADRSAATEARDRSELDASIESYLKAHPAKPAAGFERSFFIRNPEGPQILRFDSNFQLWFDQIHSSPTNPSLGSSTLTPRQPSDGDTVRFRRLQLIFSGSLTDHLAFRLMIDPARSIGVDETAAQTNRILRDIFFDYTPWTWLSFRFGQTKIPMTYGGFYVKTGALDFPEQTLMEQSFGQDREPGAMAMGKVWDNRLEYFLGVFGGSRDNRTRDENSQKDLFEWVGYRPLAPYIAEQKRAAAVALKRDPACRPDDSGWHDLLIGASRRDGVEGSEQFGRYHGDSTAVFGNLEYGPWILRAEWANGRGHNARAVSFDPDPVRENELLTRQAEGWYVTAGYNLSRKWQTLTRYQEYRRDIDEPRNQVRIVTLGLNYYLFGRDVLNSQGDHMAKIQAAYNFINAQPNSFYWHTNEFTMNFQVAW